MNLEIEVPKDIEQRISKAILESTIGDAISNGIGDIVKKVNQDSWSSPVVRAIQEMSKDIVKDMLDTPENRAEVKAAVMKAFQNEELIRKLIIESFRKD